MRFGFFFLWFLALSGLLGCGSRANVARHNLAHRYDAESNFHLEHKLLDGGNFIRIYLNLSFGAGSYDNLEQVAQQWRFRYVVTSTYESQNILLQDTLSVPRMVRQPNGSFSLIFNIKKPAEPNALMVLFASSSSGQQFVYDIPLPTAQLETDARYLLFHKGNNSTPITTGAAQVGDTILLKSLTRDGRMLFMRHYPAPFQAALPPMSTVSAGSGIFAGIRPAYTYQIKQTNLVTFQQEGYYHFSEDTLSDVGIGILVRPNLFPSLTRAPELVEPLIYITTRAERSKLAIGNQKEALDKFWLDISNNPDYGRRIIKSYYENVEGANRLFSDFREGWKTDRGMIYIIFGRPTEVLRDKSVEVWQYEERQGQPEIRFLFDRKQGFLGQPMLEARRLPDYDRYWYAVVDQWRRGIARR